MINVPKPSQHASDSQNNAAATATLAAAGSQRRLITHVSAAFSAAPTAPVLLQLKSGSTVIMEWYVATAEGISINFSSPIELTAGAAANLALAASGTGGTIGKVNLGGYAL